MSISNRAISRTGNQRYSSIGNYDALSFGYPFEISTKGLFEAVSCNNNDYYPARDAMIKAGELIERSEGNRKFYRLAEPVKSLGSIGGSP